MLKDDHGLRNTIGLRLAYSMVLKGVHIYMASYMCSFLCSSLELGLSLLSTVVTLLEPGITSLLSGVLLLHLGGQRLEDRGIRGLSKRSELGEIGVDVLQAIGLDSAIVDFTLLWLSISSGEEDDLGLVISESSDVGGLSVGALVVSSVVNSDTNSSSKVGGKTGFLELSEGESSSELDLTRVLLSASMNDRSQQTKGPRRDSSSLLSSNLLPDLLVCGLVEEAFDAPHPVLSEMRET